MTIRDRLQAIVSAMPDGASVTLPIAELRGWLTAEEEHQAPDPESVDPPPVVATQETWRERLWLVPAETRLGVREVAEALGRSTSWLYKRTQLKAEDPIPHGRLDGELVFKVGEVRAWIRQREDILVAGLMDPPTLRAS